MIAGTKRIFLHPILLFIVAGVVLFLAYNEVSGLITGNKNEIVISAGQIQLIKKSFEKTWNRPPTESELQAQIDNYVMDEVFFQQAVAMGLDRKDPAVKRRMRQLIEMMLDDYSTVYPTESQLQQYLSEHPDDFRLPSRISFKHIYFMMDDKEDAEAELEKLQAGQKPGEEAGSNLMMIPPDFEGETDFEIERLFGRPFTDAVFQISSNSWEGPVKSAYGWHLVKVSALEEGKAPSLEQVRSEVEREWSLAERNRLEGETIRSHAFSV